MRWDERSSTTLHRLLLCVCLLHKLTLIPTHSHTHTSFLFLSLVPWHPVLFTTFFSTYWRTCFLHPLTSISHDIQLSHSSSHANTHACLHLHTFLTCPVSVCSLVLPHEVGSPLCSPSIILPWAETSWQHCVYEGGEEIFSNAMQTSHPADKADGLTGPRGDTHQPLLTCYALNSTY